MELPKNLSFGDFLETIAKHLQLQPSTLKIYKDDAFKQRIFGTGSAAIDKCGITDGVCIFVANEAAKLVIPDTKPKGIVVCYSSHNRRRKESADKKRRAKTVHLHLYSRLSPEEIKKSMEWKKSLCNHGPNGKCLNCAEVTGEEVRRGVYEEKCDHPEGGKCNKCLGRGYIKDVICYDEYRQNTSLLIIILMNLN